MGTSTVHRSPATSRWRIVNRLYDQPDVDRRRLLAEIFNASREYAQLLAQPQVTARMDAAVEALQAGGGLEQARAAIASLQQGSSYTSFYADLADRALHRTVAAVQHDLTPRETRGRFFEALVAATIDHLVARDVTRWVGTAGIRTASDAARKRDELLSETADLMRSAPITRAVERLRPNVDSLQSVLGTVWDVGGKISERSEEAS